MKIILYIMLSLFLCFCASNPHEAKEIDTSIEKQKSLNDEESIGVKDGDMVYQKKVDMAEELRRLHINVYSLEDRVYGNREYGSQGLYGVLKRCRAELVHPKNGGTGKLMWTEPMDRVTDKEEEFNIGYEREKLVGVSQEFLKDRIARFKNYKKVLQSREDEYRKKVDICEAELKSRIYKRDQKTNSSNLGESPEFELRS
jgi:hypothetical protein